MSFRSTVFSPSSSPSFGSGDVAAEASKPLLPLTVPLAAAEAFGAGEEEVEEEAEEETEEEGAELAGSRLMRVIPSNVPYAPNFSSMSSLVIIAGFKPPTNKLLRSIPSVSGSLVLVAHSTTHFFWLFLSA